MGRWPLAALFVLVLGPAWAGGYDDFSRGLEAKNLGNRALEISSFTAALADSDLNPSLTPVAYLDRGNAYLGDKNCAAALADFNKALSMKPGWTEAYAQLASANVCLSKFDAALADYAAIQKIDPDAKLSWAIGRTKWDAGEFAGAAAAFQNSLKDNPKYAYAVLWLSISQMHAGNFDPVFLVPETEHVDSDDWPAPILALYRGTGSVDAVNAAAAKADDPESVAGQQCEAKFYIAEWWLNVKNFAAAKPLLQHAAGHCPHDFIEYSAAKVELGRLK